MYCRDENLVEILDELWTFTSVQQRMIQEDSLTTRQARHVSSLQRLARNSIILSLPSGSSDKERLVGPLVDRLAVPLEKTEGKNITMPVLDQLKVSYSGGLNYVVKYCWESLLSIFQTCLACWGSND